MHNTFHILLTFLATTALCHAARAEALNHDFSEFPRWEYALTNEHFTPPARPFAGDLKTALDQLHARYRQIPYQTDVRTYGESNHWATRAETRTHGAADCKGIAEAELYDLLEMGMPDESVAIEVVYVNQTGEVHAVTRVRDWVLDIRKDRVITFDEFSRDYTPVFHINRIGWARGT